MIDFRPVLLWRTATCALLLAACPLLAHAEDVVYLHSGDTLTGTIVERTDDFVRITHPDLGEMTIDSSRIEHVLLADAPLDTDDASADPLPAMADTEDGGEASLWKNSFSLGLSGSFGNTDTQSLNAQVNSTRETETTRLLLDAAYYFGSSNGDRDENRLTAGARHDWLVPNSKWFYFAEGRFDYDEFQSWEYRLSGFGGAGYELIKEEDRQLRLRAGLGLTKEFNSPNDDIRPEALFGVEYKHQLSDRQELALKSTIYPDLDDTGEFRTTSEASWSLLIDEKMGMSVNAGVFHEYQSKVGTGVDKNDLKVFAGLKFDF
jgi:putative salt-induced outer membrane protein YdiY